jgi:hypothetical protein
LCYVQTYVLFSFLCQTLLIRRLVDLDLVLGCSANNSSELFIPIIDTPALINLTSRPQLLRASLTLFELELFSNFSSNPKLTLSLKMFGCKG